MNPILKVENLTKTFEQRNRKEFAAVEGVTFSLTPGECLGIIGESGSGKTTLVNMITRLTEATGGEIFLNGENITNIRGRELRPVYRTMQMVFQNPTESFDPRATLGDGIGESLRNAGCSKKETRRQVEELLEKCGLPKTYADRYPHQVSGGQCQRAAIARALAVKPRLLICDEATSALDVTVQKEIIQLLRDLRQQQKEELSILFICHDICLVQQFCDRILVMHRGKIVEEGSPETVMQNPANAYTKTLLDSVLETG